MANAGAAEDGSGAGIASGRAGNRGMRLVTPLRFAKPRGNSTVFAVLSFVEWNGLHDPMTDEFRNGDAVLSTVQDCCYTGLSQVTVSSSFFCDAENLTRVVQRPYLLFVTESNVFSTSNQEFGARF